MNKLTQILKHVLGRISQANITEHPFYNLYVSDIFPDDFYQSLKDKMLYFKYNKQLEQRNWDNPAFINRKYSLRSVDDWEISIVKDVFNDEEIKNSLLSKFYFSTYKCHAIDQDLQFVFTEKDRYQRVHTDIPAQFLSVNFYIPEAAISLEEELDNGTILYDKELNPCKIFRYRDNSMSCFAPHFYSYHGFNTTIDNRNTMLFFYAREDLFKRFYDNRRHNENGEQDVEKFKDVVQWKMSQHRLKEYGVDDMLFLTKLLKEKADCKINTLNGRISS